MRSIGFITKKAHKKSRFGCTECKRRKQKCDEALPACGTCRKRNVACQYLPRTTPRTARSAATHTIIVEERESFSNNAAPTESPSPVSSHDGSYSLDTAITRSPTSSTSPSEETVRASLNIIHRRSSSSFSIPGSMTVLPWRNDFEQEMYVAVCDTHRQSMVKPGTDNATREIWLDVVPKVALRAGGTLFQLMLSLGSLLAATKTSDYPCLQPGTQADKLWRISSAYFSQAVSSFRNSIMSGQMYDTNPQVFYVTALVLSYRMSLYANHRHTNVETLYDDTLGWFAAAMGYIDLGGFFTERLRNTQLGHILEANPGTTYHLFPFLQYIASQEFPRFDYLRPNDDSTYTHTGDPGPEDLTKEALHAYTMSIKLIGWVHREALADKLDSEVFTYYHIVPFMVPKHFLFLLQQRKPRAIAILAHHIALLAFVGVYERFHFWPREHIRLLKEIVPLNWTWALDKALDLVTEAEQHRSVSMRNRLAMARLSLAQPGKQGR